MKDWQGEVETLGEWQSQLNVAENIGETRINEKSQEHTKLICRAGGAAVLPMAAKEELTLVELTHCDNKMVTKVGPNAVNFAIAEMIGQLLTLTTHPNEYY